MSDVVGDHGISYTPTLRPKNLALYRLLFFWRKPTKFRRILGNHG